MAERETVDRLIAHFLADRIGATVELEVIREGRPVALRLVPAELEL